MKGNSVAGPSWGGEPFESLWWDGFAMYFVVVQSLSRVWSLWAPWTAARQASLSFTIYRLEFAQIQVHWVNDAIQPSYPVIPSSSCPQSFSGSWSFPMSWFFTSGGQSIGASTSASVLPMNNHIISFRIDWFDLLVVQGTHNSLHHTEKGKWL